MKAEDTQAKASASEEELKREQKKAIEQIKDKMQKEEKEVAWGGLVAGEYKLL